MSDGRVFNKDFKREGIRLAQKSGYLSATACNLRVHTNVLQRWKRALQSDKSNPFSGQGNPADPELARLQRKTRVCRRGWKS